MNIKFHASPLKAMDCMCVVGKDEMKNIKKMETRKKKLFSKENI
jgi:hypothetical protein